MKSAIQKKTPITYLNAKKYQELNEKIKGNNIQEVLSINTEIEIATFLKEVIRRKEKESKEEKPKKKSANTAPLSLGLSLPDGRG